MSRGLSPREARRFRLDIGDVGNLTVTRTSEVEDLRRVYAYEIRDADGAILERGRDLRSGCSADFAAHPPPRELTRSLLSFLTGAPDLFNQRTAVWAQQHDDELWLAHQELGDEEDPLW